MLDALDRITKTFGRLTGAITMMGAIHEECPTSNHSSSTSTSGFVLSDPLALPSFALLSEPWRQDETSMLIFDSHVKGKEKEKETEEDH
jgi:hypothetical protein